LKKIIGMCAGFVAAATIIAFAITVYRQNIPQNIATWGGWFVLDAVILLSMITAGNTKAYLIGGYTVGAGLVTIIVLTHRMVVWGSVEVTCLIGAAIAGWFGFLSRTPQITTILATITMFLAGFPTIVDAWYTPNPQTWWLWVTCAICSVITVATEEEWTIEHQLFPIASSVFNGLVAILVLR